MINLATLTIKLQGNAFDNGSTQYICAARCSLISSVMKWSYLGAVPASIALHRILLRSIQPLFDLNHK